MKKIIIFIDIIRDHLGLCMEKKSQVALDLISFQITKATGLPLVSCFDCIDTAEFLRLNGFNTSTSSSYEEKVNTWAYLSKNITKEAEEYLLSCFKDSFVISTHGASFMLDILNRNNILFLDYFETAYRFMQDTYIGFRTNVLNMRKILLTKALSINTMYAYAQYLKAFYRKESCYYEIDDNSCLLIGQMPQDSVLIKEDGSFANLLDYKAQILALAKKYTTLYYRSSIAGSLPKEVHDFLRSIPNIKEINHNFYALMACDGIKEVAGLNSGAIYEAKFFGKKNTFFFKKSCDYYQDIMEANNHKTYIVINSNKYIFKINFWAEILGVVVPTQKVSEIEDIEFDNYQNIYCSVLRVPSACEVKPYLLYDAYKSIGAQLYKLSNLENQVFELSNNINKINDDVKNSINIDNVRRSLKKIFINIICVFIPTKKLRRKIRNNMNK